MNKGMLKLDLLGSDFPIYLRAYKHKCKTFKYFTDNITYSDITHIRTGVRAHTRDTLSSVWGWVGK